VKSGRTPPLPKETTRREDADVARRPVCCCGACTRCTARAYIAARRADPAYLEKEAEHARARRAAKAADKTWRERERRRRRRRYRVLAADPDWRARRNERSRRAMAKRRALLASAVEPGATLQELVERTGRPLSVLAAVMASEVRLGRVVTAPDGHYRLVAARFPPETLAALGGLSAPDVAELANGNGHQPRGDVDRPLHAAEWSNISHAVY
jgi:hypothetical protein